MSCFYEPREGWGGQKSAPLSLPIYIKHHKQNALTGGIISYFIPRSKSEQMQQQQNSLLLFRTIFHPLPALWLSHSWDNGTCSWQGNGIDPSPAETLTRQDEQKLSYILHFSADTEEIPTAPEHGSTKT